MANKYPIADGTFIQSDLVENWDDAKWQSEFNYLKQVKMNYIVMGTSITTGDITKTIYKSTILGAQMEYPQVDIVDMCLRNAQKCGIKVFLGINYNTDWWKKSGNDPKWLYTQMERGNLIANELYIKYYSKYPNAFYGWYFVYEVDNLNFKCKHQFSVLSNAININLKYLEERNQRLHFMISPFMNSKYGTPKKYAKNWAYLFKHTDLEKGDIFCPQDSVGGGGLNIDEVDAWFREFRKAVNIKPGLLFWANVETFNHINWSSAPLNRFIKQMEIESAYVDNIITFAYSHYYSPNNIDKGFHETYLNYIEKGFLEDEKPTSPSKLLVKQLGENRILISWQNSSDNFGVYGYEVYCNNVMIFSSNIQRIYGGKKADLSTNFVDTPKLKLKKQKFTYEVKAIDFAGNVSNSSKLTVYLSLN